VTIARAAAGQEVAFHVDLYRRMLPIRRFEEHGVSPDAVHEVATDFAELKE
jgi:hypothetical protein